MRAGVQSLLLAALVAIATTQHDADAALKSFEPAPLPEVSLSPPIKIFPGWTDNTLAPVALADLFAQERQTAWSTFPTDIWPQMFFLGSLTVALPQDSNAFEPLSKPESVLPPAPIVEAPPNSPQTGARLFEDPIKRAREGHPRKRSKLQNLVAPMGARIQFDRPTLGPMAHARFCLNYVDDCRPGRMLFRGFVLTAEREDELVRINAEVNRDIRPMRVNEAVADEKWLISPKAGDCNDYAVTKRHKLLARGWPARSLLLAEVVTTWGEHHLVLVIRTRNGDLVADNLDGRIRNWASTPYEWVRMQLPKNPQFWSTIKAPPTNVMAMTDGERPL